MAHMVIIRTDRGTVYRECHVRQCSCEGVGRKHSTRCDVVDGRAMLPGHGVLYLGRCPENDEDLGCVISSLPLPSIVKSASVVEMWIPEPSVCCRAERPLRIENACGRLQLQNMESLIDSPLVRKVNKSFGRTHCLFTAHGNITFDSCFSKPQFRGVKDFAAFLKFLHRIDVQHDVVKVHLIVLSASIGRCVSVSSYGILRHHLSHVQGFSPDGGMDDDTNCLRFTVNDASGKFKTSIAISRRGCVLMRMIWTMGDDYSEEILHSAKEHASSIVSEVCRLC